MQVLTYSLKCGTYVLQNIGSYKMWKLTAKEISSISGVIASPTEADVAIASLLHYVEIASSSAKGGLLAMTYNYLSS